MATSKGINANIKGQNRLYNYMGKTLVELVNDKDLVDALNRTIPTTQSFAEIYVDRRFDGIASAMITADGVTSTNKSYLKQLSEARVGNASRPFPDPYSALQAVKASIVAGDIQGAMIIVKPLQRWTVGSDEKTKNGDELGNPAAATE